MLINNKMTCPPASFSIHSVVRRPPGNPAPRYRTGFRAWLHLGTVYTLCLFLVAVGDREAAAQDGSSLSVLSLNARGFADSDDPGVDWHTRYGQIASWLQQHGVSPDIIALNEFWGWERCFFPRRIIGDYDGIDWLLERLRSAIGKVYRVAYLTGEQSGYGLLSRCQIYRAQALLYNAKRLVNLTAQEADLIGGVPHDSSDNLNGVAHRRRSLPLCERGTRLMPLEALIDGPMQTDKCSRDTPSGPAWALTIQSTAENGIVIDQLVASFVRFSLVEDPSRTLGVFHVYLPAGAESAVAPAVKDFISQLAMPPDSGTSWYYPPLLVGDFNRLAGIYSTWFSSFTEAFTAFRDTTVILSGKPDRFASQCRARVTQRLSVPLASAGTDCQHSAGKAERVHCGAFVSFEQDGPNACEFRGIVITKPRSINGPSDRLVALPAGGGPEYAYRWQPGGITTPYFDASPQEANTEQTWTVEVTDLRTHKTLSQSLRETAQVQQRRLKSTQLREVTRSRERPARVLMSLRNSVRQGTLP